MFKSKAARKRIRCISLIISKEVTVNSDQINKTEAKPATKLIPARKWSNYHPYPSQGSMNGLLLRRKENGLDQAVVRLNNRLYISEADFFKWALAQGGSNGR